ncbi:MAG: hypothetical protein CMA21_04645 [Euryarchaeota archaeon]|nr:hypothetical protein [Euryarchaeota archaeon]
MLNLHQGEATRMDKFLQHWIEETIEDHHISVGIHKINIRSILFAAIANYRAPAWVQSPLKHL